MAAATNRILLLVVTVIGLEFVQAQGVKQKTDSTENFISVRGKVIDRVTGEPVPDVTVTDPETQSSDITDANGKFFVKETRPNAKLTVKGENIIPKVYNLPIGAKNIIIKVDALVSTWVTPEIIYTGYQQLYKVRNTSPDFCVSEEAFQQRVSRDLAPRLEGIVPGLLLVVNKNEAANQPTFFSIGGRTTLIASPDPLIVINGFPSIGSLGSINPDDIESISILRDAAAVGIWGARAANGVVVIKTRSAKYIPRFRISFNSFTGFGNKPDLFYQDRMNAAQRIYVDSLLFKIGYFDPLVRSRVRPALSPVVEALYNNKLSGPEKAAFLDSLSRIDNRYDQERLFYRRSFFHHSSLQFAGGNEMYNFYFSLGYDHSRPEVRLSREERKTIMFNVNIKPRLPGLEFSVIASASESTRHNSGGVPEPMQPYESLTNKRSNPVAVPYKLRFAYVDTLSNKKLLDWRYYPLQEFQLRNINLTESDFQYRLGVKYKNFPGILKGLETGFLLQQQLATSELSNIHNKESFFVRDLVNSFSQISGTELITPIPKGGIAEITGSKYISTNMRFSLAYAKKIGHDSLSVLAGNDQIVTRGDLSSERIYGYSSENPSGQRNLDYTQAYPMFYFPALRMRIPYENNGRSVYHNYFSNYLSATFFWKERFDLSASFRKDKSNLYGDLINYNKVPLVSLGAAWYVNAERFYSSTLLPFVKLRANYGGSGNSPYKAYSIQTISYAGTNSNGDPVAQFNTPPLPSLRWEKLKSLNLGMNLRSANDRVELSFDWYRKSSKELIGYKPLNSTSGNYYLTGNIASMQARSAELVLETRNIIKEFQWHTSFILNYIKDYVNKVEDTLLPAWEYCDPAFLTSVPGKPLYSIFSFAYKGLDKTGNPLGERGTDYAAMLTASGSSSLIYHGRSTPALFGSLTNNFSWKQFNVSISLLYKFKYYFRKQSINYYSLFNGTSQGSTDFEKRWKMPGDELKTNVPSMPVTVMPDPNRDLFYNYSQALVARADHIRLQNLHLSYDLGRKTLKKLGLLTANFYFNCSNLGIIWRANDWRIDPDKLMAYPQPTQYAIGFRGTFK